MAAVTEQTRDNIASISNKVDHVTQQVIDQSESIQNATTAIEETDGNIHALDATIERQSHVLTNSTNLIESIMRSVSNGGQDLANFVEKFKTLVDATNTGLRLQQEVDTQVQSIVGLSQTLGDTNKVIAGIAS